MFTTYEQCVSYIFSIPMFGKKSGLVNLKELLTRLQNPHQQLKVIHVAGTNGKGSVCTLLSYIYTQHQLKVGLFTSPHLERINERIKINQMDIDEVDFLEVFNKVMVVIDAMVSEGLVHPSYFEVLFTMAVLHFKDQKVDLAILETGLGGRLDATNSIESPLVSIITQIGLDHVEILGDTLEKIAGEKAGIIKENCPTVSVSDEKAVKDVILRKCAEKKSKLYEVKPLKVEIFKRTYKTIDFSLNNKYYNYERLSVNTCALYQTENVATALTAIEVLRSRFDVSTETIVCALERFVWSGRMELIQDQLLLDGAHNESGMQVFVDTIKACFSNRKIVLLFTAMKDKDYNQMIKVLATCDPIQKVILTRVHEERCADVELMKQAFQKENFNHIEVEIDVQKAFSKHYGVDDYLLCCTGSLYLVGEIKKIVRGGFLND